MVFLYTLVSLFRNVIFNSCENKSMIVSAKLNKKSDSLRLIKVFPHFIENSIKNATLV